MKSLLLLFLTVLPVLADGNCTITIGFPKNQPMQFVGSVTVINAAGSFCQRDEGNCVTPGPVKVTGNDPGFGHGMEVSSTCECASISLFYVEESIQSHGAPPSGTNITTAKAMLRPLKQNLYLVAPREGIAGLKYKKPAVLDAFAKANGFGGAWVLRQRANVFSAGMKTMGTKGATVLAAKTGSAVFGKRPASPPLPPKAPK